MEPDNDEQQGTKRKRSADQPSESSNSSAIATIAPVAVRGLASGQLQGPQAEAELRAEKNKRDPKFLKGVRELLASKHGWSELGTGRKQPATAYKSGPGVPGQTKGKGKLDQAIGATESVVTERKRFSANDEDIRQRMRWISTAVRNYLESEGKTGYEEIQAGLDPERQQIILAANIDARNQDLKAAADGMAARAFLLQCCEAAKHQIPGHPTRHLAHPAKLTAMLGAAKVTPVGENRSEQMIAWFEALSVALDKPIVVATGRPTSAALIGWHAERRIAYQMTGEFDKPVDWRLVAGLKRPCTFCFISIYHDLVATARDGFAPRTGPLWDSAAAGHTFWPGTMEELADKIHNAIGYTCISYHATNAKGLGFDTDSEDETETDAQVRRELAHLEREWRAVATEKGKSVKRRRVTAIAKAKRKQYDADSDEEGEEEGD